MTLALVAVMTMSAVSLSAQNKFKGTVKYEISSVGSTAIDIPVEQRTAEYKVMDDKVIQGQSGLQEGRTLYNFRDLSQLIMYFGAQDIELESYQGDGKIYTKHTFTQEEIDSLTIPCTEGYYVEYQEGSKLIAGQMAKKAVVHIFGEDGQDNPMEVWYCPEIGPEVNFLVLGIGINGMPLEFQQDLGEGRMLRLQATTVEKGKVKDLDFLKPAGFKEMGSDEFREFMMEVQEQYELLME